MHARNFSFDKFKNKVSGRRSSESSILELGSTKSGDRRNSISNPMIIISESLEHRKLGLGSHQHQSHNSRLRTQSLSLSANPNSRNRSRSVNKKQTKELIKQETAQVISKKLLHVLSDLGLQQPIPLKTTSGNVNGPVSKTAKVHVANTHDCIYLAPASSASFTYEDVENGGVLQDDARNQPVFDDDDDDDDDEDDNDHIPPNDNDIYSDDYHTDIDDDGSGSPSRNSATSSHTLGVPSQSRNNLASHGADADSGVFSDDDDADSGSASSPLVPNASHSRSNSSSAHNNANGFNPHTKSIPKRLRRKMSSFSSPNYLCTKIDSDTPIPHTFAVIIELDKDTLVKDVKIEFQSLTNILWPSGDAYNKTFIKEKFKIGHMEWSTTLNDADFYISSSNSNDIRSKNITTSDLARRTREYKLVRVRDLASQNGQPSNHQSSHPDIDMSNSSSLTSLNHSSQYSGGGVSSNVSPNPSSHESHKAGLYVFLLPILLPEHIPPTISSINGSLTHNLSVAFNKSSEKLSRKSKVCASYNLPMVRTPPSFANSIADKPIYVNRVWNDALHYVITFPKKYVSLGSEHSINVKLVPLVKDVIIKRIKFNVLERITYICKDLSREYDYDGDDPYYIKPLTSDNKTRERVVPVCELKTKNKSTASNQIEPYKEEVIKCPDNNLLFSCYEPQYPDDIDNLRLDDPLSKPNEEAKETMIASPLDINIALPFLTTRSDKTIMTSSINNNQDEGLDGTLINSLPNPAASSTSRKASIAHNGSVDSQPFTPSSPIIGALETSINHGNADLGQSHRLQSHADEELKPDFSSLMPEESHNLMKENIQQGYTSVSKALSPDCNFRHIQIHHRLQVCFRISKPDPKDDFKMHHYEVVVDTPLILLSAKCNDDSIQLPKYDEIDAPHLHAPSGPGNNSASDNDGIAFRTPNFENNGISIKPLIQDDGEQLPSFEEAISVPSSPITRSVSLGADDPLSRIPSIIPTDPVPSYEVSVSPTLRPKDDLNPVNIDELVHTNGTTNSGGSKASRIRSSLSNSFAPPSSSTLNTGSASVLSATPEGVLRNSGGTGENNIEPTNAQDTSDNASRSVITYSDGLSISAGSDEGAVSSGSGESSLYSSNLHTNTTDDSRSQAESQIQQADVEQSSGSMEDSIADSDDVRHLGHSESSQSDANNSLDAAVEAVVQHENAKMETQRTPPLQLNTRAETGNSHRSIAADEYADDDITPPAEDLNAGAPSVHSTNPDIFTGAPSVHSTNPDISTDSLAAQEAMKDIQPETSNPQDDEQISLFTQDTREASFDQRLPLLQHQSVDNLSRSYSNFGLKNNNTNTFINTTESITSDGRDLFRQSTDNLSVVTEAQQQQAQDIYHRF